MKKRKKYYEGYLTVEATFIIPLAIIIIALLLYWGFYCYDKSISVQCSYLAVLRGSNEWERTNGELEKLVTQNLDKLIDEVILYTEMEERKVEVGLMSIEADVRGGMDIFISELRGDTTTRWELSSRKRAYRLKPSSYIRKHQLLKE